MASWQVPLFTVIASLLCLSNVLFLSDLNAKVIIFPVRRLNLLNYKLRDIHNCLLQNLQLNFQIKKEPCSRQTLKLFFVNTADSHNQKETTPACSYICYCFKHFLLTFSLSESIENQYTVVSNVCTLKCPLGYKLLLL